MKAKFKKGDRVILHGAYKYFQDFSFVRAVFEEPVKFFVSSVMTHDKEPRYELKSYGYGLLASDKGGDSNSYGNGCIFMNESELTRVVRES